MVLRSTHTLATLEVTEKTFREIHDRLREAGYDHAIDPEGIDMSGIMLTPLKPDLPHIPGKGINDGGE